MPFILLEIARRAAAPTNAISSYLSDTPENWPESHPKSQIVTAIGSTARLDTGSRPVRATQRHYPVGTMRTLFVSAALQIANKSGDCRPGNSRGVSATWRRLRDPFLGLP
jgi:hypothetical protein